MKGLLTYKILFILLIFMSSSLTGGTASTKVEIVQGQNINPNIQDTLYKERIQNINRLEQMKYVVQKMAN